MAAIDDLLNEVDDPALKAQLRAEFDRVTSRRSVGLVWEAHLPEKVRLPGHPVRRGLTVEERAQSKNAPSWRVVRVRDGIATIQRQDEEGEWSESTKPVEELVVVREFGDPIYPGLQSVGRVERSSNKPFHAVINAENYHALEALLYTCEEQVDCIYIDPPYNTGARDWKYNNDYVDGNDSYRHSKWLSFMEKRLLLAKRLLNPESSVLIATIDEKEYLRLGLLLEQVFPEATVQMVSSVINRSGTPRDSELSRVDEYIYFVFLGAAGPCEVPDDMLSAEVTCSCQRKKKVRWDGLMRTGTGASRRDSPKLFYPIFVDAATRRFHSVGAPLPLEDSRSTVQAPPGTQAHFPIRSDGTEGRWQLSPQKLADAMAAGTARVGRSDANDWGMLSFSYLKAGQLAKIDSGEIKVTGREDDGSLILEGAEEESGVERLTISKTVWNRQSHSAADYGSTLLRDFLPRRRFPYPKSLYAVEDTLRIAVAHKKDALIVDFFGGSGTTAHALLRLNKQDGGSRRGIVITNNEVSGDEAELLEAKGLKPGDPEWEALGIFEYITKPRLTSAITGNTPEGDPIKGDYKFADNFPRSDGFEENIEFYTLTYEDADRVRLGVAFERIAPLLWLKAGAQGPRIEAVDGAWELPEGGRYGVLFDADQWSGFTEAIARAEGVTHAFVVTDSDVVFQRVAAELSDGVEPVRLYESYLSSFAINTGDVQ